MDMAATKARKNLAADCLFRLVRNRFGELPDPRTGEKTVALDDVLMSAFAMFSLKDPSLLAFDRRRDDPNDNFRAIYGIHHVPSDTQMRTILDEVSPDNLYPLFKDVFRQLQRGKVLEPFVFLEGCYLVSLDGTNYFSSEKIHCPSCLERRHRGGTVTYSHQLLGATLVHPDRKEVIPFAPEPIVNRDGNTKNDCERNAARRWLARFRQDHPRLPVIIVEDGLSANAPHLRDLHDYHMHYILGAKEGDHGLLFRYLQDAEATGQLQVVTLIDTSMGILHHFRFLNGVPLNESHPDLLVNVMEYWEIRPNRQVQYFSWITDFPLTPDNVFDIMRGGRARWKIENETFNTLKNQGYNLEHNYGHGHKHLSVVLALLMMLTFLVDQTQQLSDTLFQAAWKKKRNNKRSLWEEIRHLFHSFVFISMRELYEAILRGIQPQTPVLLNNTS